LTHVLGFSIAKYPYYGPNLAGNANTVIYLNRTDGDLPPHPVSLIATPKLTEAARNYFNCPSLEGLELEDQGGAGTAGSHWERRMVYNEYMTGTSSYNPVISNFTLALLEDTGWYKPNYDMAADLEWGKGQKCPFAMQRCTSRTTPYTCDPVRQSSDEGCTWDGNLKGRCNIITYNSDLDPWYQYFGSPTIGGSDTLADYCGFYHYNTPDEGDCRVPQFQTSGNFYNFNSFGEHFCETCRCINVKGSTSFSYGGSCHNFTCVGNTNQMKIEIGEVWYDCDTDGQQLEVQGLTFICPTPADRFCGQVSHYDDWTIKFVSITPTKGAIGSTITIQGKDFGTAPRVTLGIDYGCYDPSVQIINDTIVCQIGVKAKPSSVLREDTKVDVTIHDSVGRSDTGFSAFTLSAASHLLNTAYSFVVVVMLLVL